MKRVLIAFAGVLLAPATLAADCSPAGRYRLEGVMEMGSGLLLEADGTYRWYAAYGALDQVSEGRWRREGDIVVLSPEKSESNDPATPVFVPRRLLISGDVLTPEGMGEARYVKGE